MTSVPPEGRLFQERLRFNPFWMLVACQLVNLTHWRQAEPVFRQLLATYLTPEVLARAAPGILYETLRPLGLGRKRAATLIELARAWIDGPPGDYDGVLGLPGCGKYAADSWAIFVEGRTDVEPDDGKLSWYVRQRRQ